MTSYVGPATIACPLHCDVPAGVEITEVPRPRHAWGDVAACPNGDDGCERAFLITRRPETVGTGSDDGPAGERPADRRQ